MRRYLPTLLVVLEERMQVIDVDALRFDPTHVPRRDDPFQSLNPVEIPFSVICLSIEYALGIYMPPFRAKQFTVMLTVSRLSHMTRYTYDAT